MWRLMLGVDCLECRNIGAAPAVACRFLGKMSRSQLGAERVWGSADKISRDEEADFLEVQQHGNPADPAEMTRVAPASGLWDSGPEGDVGGGGRLESGSDNISERDLVGETRMRLWGGGVHS